MPITTSKSSSTSQAGYFESSTGNKLWLCTDTEAITSQGNIVPYWPMTFDLGSSTNTWKSGYFMNNNKSVIIGDNNNCIASGDGKRYANLVTSECAGRFVNTDTYNNGADICGGMGAGYFYSNISNVYLGTPSNAGAFLAYNRTVSLGNASEALKIETNTVDKIIEFLGNNGFGYFYDNNNIRSLYIFPTNSIGLSTTKGNLTATLVDSSLNVASSFTDSTVIVNLCSGGVGANIVRGSINANIVSDSTALSLTDGVSTANFCNTNYSGYISGSNGSITISDNSTGSALEVNGGDGNYVTIISGGSPRMGIDNSAGYYATGTEIITAAGFITPIGSDDGSAPNNSIYYSTTQGKLAYKDPSGNVNVLY